MNISVIMTCHNRKEKTIRCLDCLFMALDTFNAKATDPIALKFFITDDGCTDGTAEGILSRFADRDIIILPGDGNLYWAGGMRLAWRKAAEKEQGTSFYLLANDDTYAMANLFNEMLDTHAYCRDHYHTDGIYSAVTCEPEDCTKISYSGDRYDNKGRLHRLAPIGVPQQVDITNANMLLVPQAVVKDIGIFYDGYRHGGADNDYAMLANRHGHPAFITANVCAICAYDHPSDKDVCKQLITMTLKERERFFANPVRSDHDYLLMIHRNFPMKYPITWLLRKIRFYLPKLYLKINQSRGIY